MAPVHTNVSHSTGIQGSTYKNLTPFETKTNLGMEDFFKILAAQLMHQDPLNPMDDREFIAQMTTFNTLQQITEMNQTFKDLRSIMLGQSTSLIGKEITYTMTYRNPDNPDQVITEYESGTVLWVENIKGKTYLQMDNGHQVDLESVLQIFEPKSPVIDHAHLIGKQVTYGVKEDDDSISEKVSSVEAVSFKEGTVRLVLENGDQIMLSDVLKVENP